jgi:GT2 family glycosyltransferase
MERDRVALSIILVSYNTREMILDCLRSVYEQTHKTQYEIIVVDNNSSDGSADAIRSEFSDIRLISLGENIGFGRANNVAAREAQGRRLLLLNPDTLMLDQAIDRLVAFADATPRCRVWGGRTLFADGTLNPGSCWRRMGLWSLCCFLFGLSHLAPNSRILNAEGYGGWRRDTIRYVDIVSGCFFMIDRDLWDVLGGFDPTFFLYGEEADLCLRALRAGARPAITPDATIIHYGGASSPSSIERRIALLKGKCTLIVRHWAPIRRAIGRTLFLAAPLIRWALYGIAARLSGRSQFGRMADEWALIWQRRSEWIGGYDAAK